MKRGEEFYIQKDIVLWTKAHHKDWVIFSCPNEATFRAKQYFSELGTLRGVSDLIVINADGIYFVECKAPKGRQSIEQRQFEADVQRFGYEYHIVHSLEEYKSRFNKN